MVPEPRLLETAIRRWWVVLLAFAITTALTILWVSPKPSVYKSSGTYVVEPKEGTDSVRALEALLRPGAAINATYALIARSDAMKEAAEAQLASIPPDANLKIDAEAVTGTNALTISGQAREARTAHALATAAGTAAIEHVDGLGQPYKLVMLDAPDLPSSPVNSRKSLTIVLGSLLGLMVGLGIAAIMDRIALLRRERRTMPVETFSLDPVPSTSTSTLAARQTLAVPPPAPATPRLAPVPDVATAYDPRELPSSEVRTNDVIIDATSHPSVQADLARAAHAGATYSLGIFRVDPASPGNGNGSNGHSGNGNGANGHVNGASRTEPSRRFEPLHAEAVRNGLRLNQIDDDLFAVVLPDTSAVSASKLLSDWLAERAFPRRRRPRRRTADVDDGCRVRGRSRTRRADPRLDDDWGRRGGFGVRASGPRATNTFSPQLEAPVSSRSEASSRWVSGSSSP